ncbi:MAG: hypothetical protein ABI703_02185 [Gemmatimonadales bacterium]
MRRTLTLAGFTTLALNLASFGFGTMPMRPDTSRAALVSLGQEYGDVKLWATAIVQVTDTLESAERASALAHQLARVMGPLERDFERATASLSTAQLEQILPLWERMVFAHAGFVLLQERVATLGLDPSIDPSELHDLAYQLSVVLDVAAEIQRRALTELITPPPTPIRAS